MNYKMMGRFIAQTLFVEAAFMLPALVISLAGGEKMALLGFGVTIAFVWVAALLLWLLCRKAQHAMGPREGLVSAASSWIIMSLVGCLPFWISREIPQFIDAFFEIVSGFTTTGASVVANVEGLSKGILYWRSFSHWLGGMGVLVFLLAVNPGQQVLTLTADGDYDLLFAYGNVEVQGEAVQLSAQSFAVLQPKV